MAWIAPRLWRVEPRRRARAFLLGLMGGEPLPETEHDFRMDVIVTPDEVIRTPAPRRPPGILWDHLADDKISAIHALRYLPYGTRQLNDDLARFILLGGSDGEPHFGPARLSRLTGSGLDGASVAAVRRIE